ncbi:MAG: thiosulfate dehydrogenase (quinone) large subunit [Propionibacteriaceae bacterium]|nr:DoxX family protein [Propionibacteriaceae bacterium]MDX6322084.1 thiosulfate dehydrogenase (quinone) large subunit [Propionibacteriaceae bacterium]
MTMTSSHSNQTTTQPAATAAELSDGSTAQPTAPAQRWLAVVRIGLGLVFGWAFLDKLLGLGYATPAARAWVSGGSPTAGFLGNVEVGPLAPAFRGLAGSAAMDWLFMVGLAGIGLALLAGMGVRVAAGAGALMMVLMWMAEWPLASTTAAGEPSGSSNPLIDSHLIYAAVLIVCALANAGRVWGLGRRWQQLTVVRRHPWLV